MQARMAGLQERSESNAPRLWILLLIDAFNFAGTAIVVPAYGGVWGTQTRAAPERRRPSRRSGRAPGLVEPPVVEPDELLRRLGGLDDARLDLVAEIALELLLEVHYAIVP